MEHTANYSLSQWAMTDRIQVQDFNADNAKIDAALSEHDSQLAQLGNCRVEAFSYTGTGVKGNGQKRRIAFSARPILMVIIGGGNILWANGTMGTQLFLGTYAGANYNLTLTGTDLTWEGNTAVLGSSDPATRMDNTGTYGVIALFAEDR